MDKNEEPADPQAGYIKERDVANDPRFPVGLEELRAARQQKRIRHVFGCRTYWYRPEWIQDYIDSKTEVPSWPDKEAIGNIAATGSANPAGATGTTPIGTKTPEIEEREERAARALRQRI